jgi:hypothetical protein
MWKDRGLVLCGERVVVNGALGAERWERVAAEIFGFKRACDQRKRGRDGEAVWFGPEDERGTGWPACVG